MYPLISEYIEAIKSAEDNFKELANLRAVQDDDGQPVMTSGNFAVVFKMEDSQTGKHYAVKCFTKEQEGRTEAYREIAKELKDVDSPYLVPIQLLENELFVDTGQTDETEFPVLLMDWVDGKPLDKYLRENLDDKYALEMLAYRFSQLAQWLIPQPFAHGDLKPDNILVRDDGTLVLVDYDGMYVPAMKGQKARELGSPDFRHPQRTENDFDERIDDFTSVSILLSLKAISIHPQLLEEYGTDNRLLFCQEDFIDLDRCQLLHELFPSYDKEITHLCQVIFSQYTYGYTNRNINISSIIIEEPSVVLNKITSINYTEWKSCRVFEENGVAKYSRNGKKILSFYDTIPHYYEGDIYEEITSQYEIRKGTETICNNAFSGCHNLQHIAIPDSVKDIGEYAFSSCYELRNFIIPNSVRTIGRNAFENCVQLETIYLEGEIKSIEDNLFAGCKKLLSIVVPKGKKPLYETLFPDNKDKIIDISIETERLSFYTRNMYTSHYKYYPFDRQSANISNFKCWEYDCSTKYHLTPGDFNTSKEEVDWYLQEIEKAQKKTATHILYAKIWIALFISVLYIFPLMFILEKLFNKDPLWFLGAAFGGIVFTIIESFVVSASRSLDDWLKYIYRDRFFPPLLPNAERFLVEYYMRAEKMR